MGAGRKSIIGLCAEECNECRVNHINVGLGNNFIGCVHGEDRNTEVDNVDVVFCDIFRNGTAAALVDLTELGGLPDDAVCIKNVADIACEFSGGIVGAGFTLRTGVLGDNNTVVYEAGVSLFGNLGEVGIERRVNVG